MMSRLLILCLLSSAALSLAYVPLPANAQKMDEPKAVKPLPKTEFPQSNAVTALPVPVTVQTVIDPLTFTDDEGRVYRLMGLDSPALSDTGDKDKPVYEQMKTELERLISGQSLILYLPVNAQGEAETLKNRMGHTLVHAIREKEKIWINGALLAEGLARVRTSEDETALAMPMLKIEAEARKAKKGLWDDPDYAVFNPANIPDNFYGFGIVEGTVRSVSAVRNTIYLNFGDDWRTDFSAGISPAARRAFAKDGANVMSWGGKTIRIRGNIRQYNGPFIDLDHSAQVEHLDGNAAQEATSQAPDQAVPSQGSGGDNARPAPADKRDNHIPFNL